MDVGYPAPAPATTDNPTPDPMIAERKTRKRALIRAFAWPLAYFVCETLCLAPYPRILGPIAFLMVLSTPLLLLIPLYAILAFPYYLIRAILPRIERHRRITFLSEALAYFVIVPLTCVALIYGASLRTPAFARAATRGDAIVRALDRYKEDHGAYPSSLDDLVPDYLAKIPYTGLIGYPSFDYREGLNDMERVDGSYELRIDCSEGVLGFDRFIFWPSETYPDRIQGNGVERIGRWAYVHE